MIDLTKPGAYEGIPFGEYLAAPGLNQSTLKHGIKSMAHVKWAQEHSFERSDAMMLGSLFDDGLFEPQSLASKYAVMPDLTEGIEAQRPKATKIYKSRAETWREELGGREEVDQDQLDAMVQMIASVRGHPEFMEILNRRKRPGCMTQAVLIWDDPVTGIRCKGRVDQLDPKMLVDLKSSRSANRRFFQKQAGDLGYHMQLVWYRSGIFALNGCGVHPDLRWLVCENKPPYGTAIFDVGPRSIESAERTTRRLLNKYAQCLSTGEWPGYPREPQMLEICEWQMDGQESSPTEGVEHVI